LRAHRAHEVKELGREGGRGFLLLHLCLLLLLLHLCLLLLLLLHLCLLLLQLRGHLLHDLAPVHFHDRW
jgi:hypothetical protein